MSDLTKEEFIERLSDIEEPPEEALSTDHLTKPYNDLKSLTDNFETEFTGDILYQMLLNGVNNVVFIQYMLNLSQNEFSSEMEDFTDRTSFNAQVKELVEQARNSRLADHDNIARNFTSYLASEYRAVLTKERVIANDDLTHEVLLETRYKEKRRSAIEAQQHGDYIEDEVEDVLQDCGLTTDDYEIDSLPPGGESDKDVDFVIPSLKLLIECKGYVNTGTKPYDAIGDVRKVDAPDDWGFVFVVDGEILGDLDTLLDEFQSTLNEEILDGLYQLDDMGVLKTHIGEIQSGRDVTFLTKSTSEIQASLTPIPTEDLELTGEDERIRAFETLRNTYDAASPVDTLTEALMSDYLVLDVFRLIFDRSEGRFTTELHPYIDEPDTSYPDYDKILKLIQREDNEEICKDIIEGLCENEELAVEINSFLENDVTYFDIVTTRYLQKFGVSVKSEHTGSYLEDEIEERLRNKGYQQKEHYSQNEKVKFTVDGGTTETSKGPDFVMPDTKNPDIVIEAKAFTCDGSKQTDVKGDLIEKFVNQIPPEHKDAVDVFLVTDGKGWQLRPSDLDDIIQLHNDGVIDGLYQICSLDELVEYITETISTPDQTQSNLGEYNLE